MERENLEKRRIEKLNKIQLIKERNILEEQVQEDNYYNCLISYLKSYQINYLKYFVYLKLNNTNIIWLSSYKLYYSNNIDSTI